MFGGVESIGGRADWIWQKDDRQSGGARWKQIFCLGFIFFICILSFPVFVVVFLHVFVSLLLFVFWTWQSLKTNVMHRATEKYTMHRNAERTCFCRTPILLCSVSLPFSADNALFPGKPSPIFNLNLRRVIFWSKKQETMDREAITIFRTSNHQATQWRVKNLSVYLNLSI